MSTHALDPRATAHPSAAVRQLRWLAGGLAFGFLVPFVFADLLALPRDLYYGVYAASVTLFFLLWARGTGQSLHAMVRRRWPLAVALGLATGALLALVVLRAEDATLASRRARARRSPPLARGRVRRGRRPPAVGVPDPRGLRRSRGHPAARAVAAAPSPSAPLRSWPRSQ